MDFTSLRSEERSRHTVSGAWRAHEGVGGQLNRSAVSRNVPSRSLAADHGKILLIHIEELYTKIV